MIEVVNVHYCEGADIEYIGRPMPGRAGSVLGNPYKLPKGAEPGETLTKYKVWLWAAMQSDTPQRRELYRLARLVKAGKKVRIGCWCKPRPCHGDVVKAAIEWLIETGRV